MKYSKPLTIILTAILLSGCVATIQSNKSPEFNRIIRKFYVVVKVSGNSEVFVPKFETKFKELILAKGVQAEFESLNPLSLESQEDLKTRIANSGADALMIISQTESVTYRQANAFYFGQQKASAGTFDIQIFEPAHDRPVWRGSLNSSSGGYGTIGAVATMSAETLVNKLIEDRML